MKNIINISEFNEIVIGIKAMKADLVCIYGNLLLGTDNSMTILKTYTMSISIPVQTFTIITKELSSKFFSNIIDTSIMIDTDECKIYCPNYKAYADENNPMINNFVSDKILTMYFRVMENINKSITIKSYGEITEDEYFERFKKMKISEGSDLYSPKGERIYSMYLYSGAVPLNKSDKAMLEIYDLGETFVSKFTIHKKKLNPVNVYFRFVKIR